MKAKARPQRKGRLFDAVQAVVWASPEPLSTAAVAAAVGPTRANVWHTLRRLESLGLIHRTIRHELVKCWCGERCRTGPIAYWSKA